MKINRLLIPICFLGFAAQAQDGIEDLLAAGVEDAKRFSNSYFAPAAEGIMYSLSNGWYNTGKGKKLGQFEISIIGNASFIKDEHKQFQLNTADYNNLRFTNPGQASGMVASSLGENNPDINMVIEYEDEFGNTQELGITLPQGIGSAGVNILPSAFLQANVGLIKGAEVKFRFLPKIDQEDVEVQLFGGGIQYEVTSLLPAEKIFPLHISAVIGYTSLKASYDFTGSSIIDGENQRVETEVDSWLFSAVASTKLPVINFYGGIGFISGNSTSSVLGTYRIQEGVLANETLVDPYSVENKVSGVKATVGFKLKLAFFRLNADYSFQEYNNLSVGLNFGI
ncbi:MAG TPA: DUF6588 family protein [Flavobacteriaceae bacterium]|nr:DUF6588 family protein [Flavobacteriaceae bacterium]